MLGRRFLLGLLGLLGLSFASAQYTCPPQGGAYAVCATTVLYIIDTSTDITDSQIRSEFDWIRFNILPGTAWSTSQKLALISYGTGNVNSFPPIGDLQSACGQLNSLETTYSSVGSSNSSLYTLLQTVNLYYGSSVTTMILFSGSKDANDISQAGNYIRLNMASQQFTVIAMNGANFNGFPATIYPVANLEDAPPNLGPCLVQKACNQGQNCNINGSPDTTLAPYTTANPHGTLPPSPSSSVQCQCNTQTAWLDIMFLMDACASTGQDGLDAMWGSAATMLDSFNVQKTGYSASNYYTKVGVITYGNDATVVYPLGSLDNNDIDGIFELPYKGDKSTNLEAAIQAAVGEFNSARHRSNARRVIFIYAAVYNPDGVTSPNKTATTFKESDGVILAYNFLPEGGLESSTLKEIASPGYFYSSTLNSQLTDMAAGLCDANCFCPTQQRSFSNSLRDTPTDGCYVEIKAQNSYARASNQCYQQYYNATVTYDQSAAKTTFLQSLFSPTTTAFYIGLTYNNIDQAWEWPNGSPVGSYQPWASGTTHDGSGGQTCVYVNSNGQWQPVDCRNGYYFVYARTLCLCTRYLLGNDTFNGTLERKYYLQPGKIQSARFRTLSISIPASRFPNYDYTVKPDLFSFFDKSKTTCQILEYYTERKTEEGIGLVTMVKRFQPGHVHYRTMQPHFALRSRLRIPLPFDRLAQLATLGVKKINVEYCGCIPPDYVQVLSKYESVYIDAVVAESTPSLAALVQLIIETATYSITLERLQKGDWGYCLQPAVLKRVWKARDVCIGEITPRKHQEMECPPKKTADQQNDQETHNSSPL